MAVHFDYKNIGRHQYLSKKKEKNLFQSLFDTKYVVMD